MSSGRVERAKNKRLTAKAFKVGLHLFDDTFYTGSSVDEVDRQ